MLVTSSRDDSQEASAHFIATPSNRRLSMFIQDSSISFALDSSVALSSEPTHERGLEAPCHSVPQVSTPQYNDPGGAPQAMNDMKQLGEV